MAKARTPGDRRTSGNQTGPAGGGAVAADAPARPKVSPAQFLDQVRAEGRKIVWPSRKETWITSVMVFLMVLIAAVFFWAVDFALGFGFQRVISLGA